jgi:ATP-dependent DNA helicase RecQ
MATGAGKSLCKILYVKLLIGLIGLKGYQLPPLISGKPTIVISPLISLMEDQVLALTEKGIKACFLNNYNSNQSHKDASVIYLSPEKLESWFPQIDELIKTVGVCCFAVDECHCISEWGHDFRPAYRHISLLRLKFPDIPIMALTATATSQTVGDVVNNLRLRNPVLVRTTFNRPNLRYEVRLKSDIRKDLTLDLIGSDSCIVYCITKKDVDEVVSHLKSIGVSADSYHAGRTLPQRSSIHHAFVRDELQVVVATVAFGMGVDKPVLTP